MEMGSRGRVHPLVIVLLVNGSEVEDPFRMRTWQVAERAIQSGIARRFTLAAGQWRAGGHYIPSCRVR